MVMRDKYLSKELDAGKCDQYFIKKLGVCAMYFSQQLDVYLCDKYFSKQICE